DVEQGPIYAHIEFISDIEIAKGLEKTLNQEVAKLENNNPPATMRFIGISEQQNKKIRYTAEIVPNSDKKQQMIEQTERFLTVLPKVFRNIRQKQIDYRKVGKEILEK
ncbi:MAG: hypothetical protein ABIC18_02175, partial [Candidatus Omnitrophota bacterium]